MVSVGALGGVRLTDGFSYGDESRIYVVGGSVEFRLPAGFALEADALFQRVGGTTVLYSINGTAFSSLVTRQRGNSWQFPLYVKYYFRPRSAAWQPFVGTGYAFRTVSFDTDTSGYNVSDIINGSSVYNFRSSLGIGAAVVAGLRFHSGLVSFLPQVRYTRWGSSDNINSNEATLLLGVTF